MADSMIENLMSLLIVEDIILHRGDDRIVFPLCTYLGSETQGQHHDEKEHAEQRCCFAHQAETFWIDDEGQLWTLSRYLGKVSGTF